MEARSMLALELRQTSHDCIDAMGARIGQRPTAKRREPGPEDHSGVEQISLLDDALAQACDRLIQHWQDQPVVRGRKVPRVRRSLA